MVGHRISRKVRVNHVTAFTFKTNRKRFAINPTVMRSTIVYPHIAFHRPFLKHGKLSVSDNVFFRKITGLTFSVLIPYK